jgi:hypothetical protein
MRYHLPAQQWNPAMLKYTMLLIFLMVLTPACSPTVRVEASDKPITINLNVKIEHEIRVKVDKELDSVLSNDSGLF